MTDIALRRAAWSELSVTESASGKGRGELEAEAEEPHAKKRREKAQSLVLGSRRKWRPSHQWKQCLGQRLRQADRSLVLDFLPCK